jgi:hypothetical protein
MLFRTHNLTPFQRKFVEDVAGRPGFQHFATEGADCTGRKKGPLAILWYQDGKLRAIRVGKTRILCDEVIS